jgi:thioredoxin-dependent peroxiredoxin
MLVSGDKVPKLRLASDDGTELSLDGPGTRVVYFYPRDDTPGCTREAQAFTASYAAFKKAGAEVVGVSRDSIAAHCRFRDKYSLRIPLLSDPELVAHRAFGAWGTKTMYGKKVEGVIRCTFIVRDGKVVHTFPSVKVDGHAEKVLAAVHALTGGGAAPAKAAAKKPAATKPATKKAAAKPATKKAATATKKPAAKAASKKAAAATKKPAAKAATKKASAKRR